MKLSHISLIVVDFDGVLTNNTVSVNSRGDEFYSTSKYDSLGLSYFRKRFPHVHFAVLTSELNESVICRCDKLQLPVYHAIECKKVVFENILTDFAISPANAAYIGNDLNDIPVKDLRVSVLACPLDAHPSFKKLCNIVLPVEGGKGVLRSFLDQYLDADHSEYSYQPPTELSHFKSMGHREWGEESLVTVCSGFYSVKRLFIKKGFAGGLQYHHMKDETGFVFSGVLRVYYQNEDGSLACKDFSAGDFFRFKPGCIHKEEAVEDTIIIEVSTPYFNDRVRVESDFCILSHPNGLASTSVGEVMQLEEYPPSR